MIKILCFRQSSEVSWTANGSSHSYAFSYDGLNRLFYATHDAGRFSENVTAYDKNGNITGLQRYGQTATSAYGLIDNLTYTLSGNQLNRVDDAATASAYNNGFEFKDGVKQANEYAYDANGNLTKDLNAGISNIQYNCLNLPQRIDFSASGFAQYGYTMDGIKRRKQYMPEPGSRSPVTIAYCGNVVYEESEARILLTEEGYVTLDDGKYHYYLQDHQGNNRVVISQSGTVEETNHYYPFGGMFAGTNSIQPYKYNGKEMNARKELKWYDYGARHYDAALGRFTTVDPSAENYYDASLYAYCGNNPANRIDPDGMDYWSTNDPETIRKFLNSMQASYYSSGNFFETIDFSSWNHSTDAEFLGKLTFNDQTNMFYTSYGTIENGIPTSVGISFPALRNDGKVAWLEGGRSKWYKRASGRLENVYPEFDLLFASTKSGWNILKNIFTSMFRSFSTTNTFDANKSGIIHSGGNREKMGRAKGNMSGNREVQKEQINSLCQKYNLDRSQRETLHRLVRGEGYGYQEIEHLIKDYFKK